MFYGWLQSRLLHSLYHGTCLKRFVYLFISLYFLLCWNSITTHRLHLVAASGGYCFLWGRSCSLPWFLWSWSMGSRVFGLIYCSMWAQECWLSNCGTWAQLPCSGWNLDGPGIGIMPSALASGFITTGPEGSPLMVLWVWLIHPSWLQHSTKIVNSCSPPLWSLPRCTYCREEHAVLDRRSS